ncbi:MAG: diaminopimelate epimerase, partial [Candidatus Methanoperedenaceae archaeon HGW-Methanoperedenaceae-1]
CRRLGWTGEKVRVHTKGGELVITLTDEGAFMEGPAERVFDGTLNV